MDNRELQFHLTQLKEYLDEPRRGFRAAQPPFISEAEMSEFQNTDVCFADALLSLIDEKGLKDSEVYRRADVSRSVFGNMKNGHFSKGTAIALALTLELGLEDTQSLLRKGRFVLSESYTFDKVIIYCINHKIYDTDDVNYLLHETGQPILREAR